MYNRCTCLHHHRPRYWQYTQHSSDSGHRHTAVMHTRRMNVMPDRNFDRLPLHFIGQIYLLCTDIMFAHNGQERATRKRRILNMSIRCRWQHGHDNVTNTQSDSPGAALDRGQCLMSTIAALFQFHQGLFHGFNDFNRVNERTKQLWCPRIGYLTNRALSEHLACTPAEEW